LAERAPKTGIAAASIARSHHSGVAGHQVEPLADAGLIALYFGNGPAAIAPWGGKRAVFGTNPIAFACPRKDAPPLIIDVSLSKVARGRINLAKQKGETIPEGWALDPDGEPTTDPGAAMDGTMLPLGDAKGAQLVLMVEILGAALSASHFAFEASSFYSGDGPPPHTGQCLIAIDPEGFSGGLFAARLETLLTAIAEQPGTRLPGDRRHALRTKAARDGVAVADDLYAELLTLDGANR
jgi:(2R)-3-sulfolactate dehydrogenase (NADP+)